MHHGKVVLGLSDLFNCFDMFNLGGMRTHKYTLISLCEVYQRRCLPPYLYLIC